MTLKLLNLYLERSDSQNSQTFRDRSFPLFAPWGAQPFTVYSQHKLPFIEHSWGGGCLSKHLKGMNSGSHFTDEGTPPREADLPKVTHVGGGRVEIQTCII